MHSIARRIIETHKVYILQSLLKYSSWIPISFIRNPDIFIFRKTFVQVAEQTSNAFFEALLLFGKMYNNLFSFLFLILSIDRTFTYVSLLFDILKFAVCILEKKKKGYIFES